MPVLAAILVASGCAGDEPDDGAGGDSDATTAASPEQQLIQSAQQDREFTPDDDTYPLQFVDKLQPGSKIVVHRSDADPKDCSLGWIVTGEAVDGELGAITAGHCGSVGDSVTVQKSGFEDERIGAITAVNYDADNPQDGADYGLITLTDRAASTATATPEHKESVNDPQSPGWAQGTAPYMCSRGFHGTSCGPYDPESSEMMLLAGGETEHGDSGGPVWAQSRKDPTDITPLGIIYGDHASEQLTASKPLDPALDRWGLSIVD